MFGIFKHSLTMTFITISLKNFIEKFHFSEKQKKKEKENKRKSRKIIVYKKFDKNTKLDIRKCLLHLFIKIDFSTKTNLN